MFQKKNNKASKEMSVSALVNNYDLSKWLDELPWEYDSSWKCEFVTWKTINEKSVFVGSVLHNINKTRIEGKSYFKNGNLFCRHYPEMKHPEKVIQREFTYRKLP